MRLGGRAGRSARSGRRTGREGDWGLARVHNFPAAGGATGEGRPAFRHLACLENHVDYPEVWLRAHADSRGPGTSWDPVLPDLPGFAAGW